MSPTFISLIFHIEFDCSSDIFFIIVSFQDLLPRFTFLASKGTVLKETDSETPY